MANFFFETATVRQISARKRFPTAFENDLSALQKIIVTDYREWHSMQRAQLERSGGRNHSIRILVYRGSEGKSGLGDRLRGVLYSYLCAVATERLLLIKWDNPFPLDRVLENAPGSNFTYDSQLVPIDFGKNESDVLRVTSSNLRQLDRIAGDVPIIDMVSESWAHWTDFLRIRWRYPDTKLAKKLEAIVPFHEEPTANDVFPLVLQGLFRTSDELREMMSVPRRRQNRFTTGRLKNEASLDRVETDVPYISIHSRLGKGVDEGGDRFDLEQYNLTVTKVAKCMAHKAMQIAEWRGIRRRPRFFLSTDTPEFRVLFEREVLKLDSESLVMYAQWDVTHVNGLKNGTNEEFQTLLETFMDVYLLSQGESLMYFKSGFADLAMWMGALDWNHKIELRDCEKLMKHMSNAEDELTSH